MPIGQLWQLGYLPRGMIYIEGDIYHVGIISGITYLWQHLAMGHKQTVKVCTRSPMGNTLLIIVITVATRANRSYILAMGQ